MSARAQIAAFSDGRRHFHDGPIDLIVGAEGEPRAVAAAYAAAEQRFATILDELCAELPLLRTQAPSPVTGVVARRMAGAVAPFASRHFITPMAAVAGAVAEEVLQAMTRAAKLRRAYVNNGGDIALHLTPGESYVVGMAALPSPLAGEGSGMRGRAAGALLGKNPSSGLRPPSPARGEGVDLPAPRSLSNEFSPLAFDLFGRATIRASDLARGVATSGWRGRSFSLGIADAVTVIASTASLADAAATLIANAVDLPGHRAIERVPASQRAPDSDLGDRLVTVNVAALAEDEIAAALARGAHEAEEFLDERLIEAAALDLQGRTRLVGAAASLYKSEPAALPCSEVEHAFG